MIEQSTLPPFVSFLSAAAATFAVMFFLFPGLLGVARLLCLYTIVREREARVYVLFGKVLAVIDQPGLHLLPLKLGPMVLLVNFLGKCHSVDLRLDQQYLRSTPVNSEEGAPMGIGIWYEMRVSDPLAYLFKNADPRGSLAANVSNSTTRCLNNLPLARMLQDRHVMSQSVRSEVSPRSEEWGYGLGSVYIRKVHFRDLGMIRQIEAKVVNRLRQVTSAIKQDGTNQVNVIASTAEQQAAAEFARAAAIRPQIVGEALRQVSSDPAISEALFEVLETQSLLEGKASVTLVPGRRNLMTDLLAASGEKEQAPNPTR
jgi:regulator of protease activity HflC (stomatin/prohibitin superfamily)